MYMEKITIPKIEINRFDGDFEFFFDDKVEIIEAHNIPDLIEEMANALLSVLHDVNHKHNIINQISIKSHKKIITALEKAHITLEPLQKKIEPKQTEDKE